MAYNTDPVSSVDDVRSKYAKYFEQDDKSIVSTDTFFQLLMAEMTNQDPLEPTSNTEFVSQLASFTALQTNEDSLYYNTVSYASGLAGKTVTVAVRDGNKTDENGKVKMKLETGVVTGVDISDDKNVEFTMNGKRYALSDIKNVASNATASPLSTTDGAYAVSLIGKSVLLQADNADGDTIIDSGIVDSIEVENGVYRIVVNNLSYPLDSVIRVSNPADSSESTGGASGSDSNAENQARAAAAAETRTVEAAAQNEIPKAEDKVQATENNGLMDMILYS